MTYTTVPTVSTGDVWTASNHNLYIRDNFRATIPDQVTAKGELVVGSEADALELLTVGADGQILRGDINWFNVLDFMEFCSTGDDVDRSFNSSGSGNYHVPTNFEVPEGASWIYCKIERQEGTGASTGYFALYPSYDTSIEVMRVNAYADDTNLNTSYSQCHGVMPLDSTGGLFYLVTDTAVACNLQVFAWMY